MQKTLDFNTGLSKIFQCLKQIALNQKIAELNAEDFDSNFQPIVEAVNHIAISLREINNLARDLSEGKLNDTVLSKTNYLSSEFKELRAKLKHLSWQAKQVKDGDYSQRLEYFGELSNSVNSMIEGLDTREKELILQKENYKQLSITMQLALDNMSERVFIVDTETVEILYMNEASKRHLDEGFRMDGLCELRRNCENIASFPSNAIAEYYCEKSQAWYQMTLSSFMWTDERPAFLLIEKDITTVKEKQSLQMYNRLLLEYCPDIVILLDNHLNILLATDSILKLFGRDARIQSEDHSFPSIAKRYFPEDVYKRFLDALESILAPDSDTNEKELSVSIEGHKYQVYIIRFISGFSGILILMHDATEIIEAKNLAEQANRSKSDFLANMSHEIRTPMNAIIGLLDFISDEPLTDRQSEYIMTIKQSSRVLLSVINDILDFSKIEAGKLTLVPQNFELIPMLQNINTLATTMAETKNITYKYEFSDSLPQYVFMDENRLRQAIMNLIVNAVKFTNAGYVLFRVRTENGTLLFEVIDTGIGIKEEEIESLFKPFEQLDQRRNRNAGGTGLGLTITRHLCEAMGGHISAESNYNQGSRFTISLPYSEGSKIISEDDYMQEESFSAPHAKVLVVDDIDINLFVAQAILGSFDIMPDIALSGAEALDRIREVDYDLIFMDQMMPEMDGFETTALIREYSDHYRKIPIVALTANAFISKEMSSENVCFNDYLTKPLDLSLMEKCLKKWLKEM